jgi:protein TonB
MYRSDLNSKDRSGALIAVAAIHGALLFALLHLSGRIDLTDPQSVLRTFDVTEVPPPPPPRKQNEKPKDREGGSSPRNIKSEATPVAAPKPKVAPLLPNPVVVTEVPRQGAAPTQGAAEVRGPGTGAGGLGSGTGSGLGGAGSGGGGGGGVAVGVRLIRGIGGRDYPREIMAGWPRGGRIDVILRIEANGRVSSCRVGRSFGNPMADQWTCALITQRGQFRPALDRSGRPVASWFGYSQADR